MLFALNYTSARSSMFYLHTSRLYCLPVHSQWQIFKLWMAHARTLFVTTTWGVLVVWLLCLAFDILSTFWRAYGGVWQFPTQPHAWSMWRGMAVPSTATRVKKVEGCGSSIHSHTRGEGGEVCLFPSHPHVKQVCDAIMKDKSFFYDDVLIFLTKLDASTSAGPDGIHPILL